MALHDRAAAAVAQVGRGFSGWRPEAGSTDTSEKPEEQYVCLAEKCSTRRRWNLMENVRTFRDGALE